MEKVVTAGQVPEKYEAAKFKTLFRRIEYAINALINGHNYTIVNTSSNYTMTVGDSMVVVDAAGGNKTVLLPLPADAINKILTVKKKGAGVNTVTITAPTGTIDGAASYVITMTLTSADFVSDGTDYWIK